MTIFFTEKKTEAENHVNDISVMNVEVFILQECTHFFAEVLGSKNLSSGISTSFSGKAYAGLVFVHAALGEVGMTLSKYSPDN